MAHGGVKIEIDLDKSKLQGSMQGLQGDIVKGMAVFEILKQGVAKIFNMVAESIDAAMKRIDTMEQFSRVMTTMTGSADKANVALDQTRDIVIGTAYGLDTAAKSVQNFVSRGMDISKATDTVAAWGDAVAFYGEGSNEQLEGVTAALSKMQTKGNVTMEHMNMLFDAGIPAVDMYASAVGISAEEVTAAMSRGELSANDFITVMNGAFVNGTTKFPSVAGAAKEAGASWAGTWDNMRAAIARGTQSIITNIDSTLTAVGAPTMRQGISAFGKLFETVLNAVGKAISAIIQAFAWLGDHILEIGIIAAGATAIMIAYNWSLVSAAVKAWGLVAAEKARAIATGLATAAQWLLNAAMNANPVLLLVTGIIALVTALAVLFVSLSRSSDAYKKEKKELEDLGDAHDEYKDKLEEDKKAAQENITAIEGEGLALEKKAQQLNGLIEAHQAYGDKTDQIKALVGELNKEVDGLNLTFDETTGKLLENNDGFNKYIQNKGKVEKANALVDEHNRLLGEQSSLQARINTLNDKKAFYKEQLDQGNVSQSEYNKLVKKANELLDEYDQTAEDLALDIKFANEQAVNGAAKAEKAEIHRYEAVAGARDSDGKNLKQLAKKYKVTTEEILNDSKFMEEGIVGWSAKMAGSMTKDGYSLDQIAAKWGMTTDQVTGYMDEWGMSLDEVDKELSDSVTAQGETLDDLAAKYGMTKEQVEQIMVNEGWGIQDFRDSVASTTKDIINNFEEIPKKYDKSLAEMIKIARENVARYAEWKSKMVYLSQHMSSESIEYLQDIGPAGLSVVDDLIKGGAEKMAEFDQPFKDASDLAVQGIEGSFKTLTPELINIFNEMNASTGIKMTEMGDIVNTETGKVVSSAVENLENGTIEMIEKLSTLNPAAIEVFNQLNADTGMQMTEFGDVINTETQETVSKGSENLKNGTIEMAETIAGLVPSAIETYNALSTETDIRMDSLGNTWDTKTGEMVATADTNYKNGTIQMVATLGELTPQVIETFNQMNAEAGIKLDETGTIFDTKTGEVVSTAAQNFADGTLEKAVKAAWDNSANAITTNDAPKKAAEKSVKLTQDAAKTGYSSGDYSKSGSTSQTLVSKGIESNKAPEQAAKTKVDEVTNTFKTGFDSAEFINLMYQAITKMADRVKVNMALVFAVEEKMKEARSSATTESNSGWYDIGLNIVRGMADGVVRNASILTNAITRTVKQGLQAAKDAADIHSPSRLFADQVGRMIPAGIGVGVDAGTPEAIASLKRMMNSVSKVGTTGININMPQYSGVASPVPASHTTNNTTAPVLQFYGDVNDPDVIARKVGQTLRYGLAGRNR